MYSLLAVNIDLSSPFYFYDTFSIVYLQRCDVGVSAEANNQHRVKEGEEVSLENHQD